MESSGMVLLQRILPLLIPLLIIQLGLIVYCLMDLSKREALNGPKWLWVILIIIGEIWGPLLYLIIGRKE